MNQNAAQISVDEPEQPAAVPNLSDIGSEILIQEFENFEQPDTVLDSQNTPSTDIPPTDNGVSLALGGGAARGWAHIGVLRAFDEIGVNISMIAGTSIGSLVGGCYLAGHLDELEEFARSITRTNMLRFMDFKFRGSGLISGNRLASRMASHLEGINIETLDRPFVAIATDIATGHEIWLQKGPMVDAIRSSYALPGVFQPVNIGGRLLVDGAIVNPVPVAACRAFESKAVIAVNLNNEIFGKGTVIRGKQVDLENSESDASSAPGSWFSSTKKNDHAQKLQDSLGVTGVMIEAFNIIQDRIARSRLAGDPPDFTIRPKLKDIGMTEFFRASEAIDYGYEEGINRIADLEDRGLLQDVLTKNA